MQYPSKLIEEAVAAISNLPGIGRKSALRLVLHLLREPTEETEKLAIALQEVREKTTYCKQCHNIADQPLCDVCSHPRRDASIICIVEDIRDVMAIENTDQYKGLYHVMGGIISPIEGIGPEDLNTESLIKRVKGEGENGRQLDKPKEIIFALSANMEGDTTAYYLKGRIREANPDVKISGIARGVPLGSDLEYTDEITLGRSVMTRIVE